MDILMAFEFLLFLIVPLFLLVVWKNMRGKGMHTRRMDSQEERERFMDDWGPEERHSLPEPDKEDAADAPEQDSGPRNPSGDRKKMDSLDFVTRLRRLHVRLERGEITRDEFQRISRRLAQQAWTDKDSQEDSE